MRSLFLAALLCLAVPVRAQEPEAVSCKIVAAQATQRLMGTALEGEPATQDEKRVFGEFQRGVVDECSKAGGETCYTRKPGETTAAPTNCPKDPVREWMATSASQIMPTQTKQNRATQVLQGLLAPVPAPAPAPVAAAPSPTPSPGLAPPPPPPPPSTAAPGAAVTPPPPPPPAAVAEATPPPEVSKGKEPVEDTPVLEGDALLSASLVNMSQRELRGMETLLLEGKPGLGLSIGMFGGGAGAIAGGSFFVATSIGYYYTNTFGLILGAAAITAGVVMIVIGSLALVSRMKTRGRYNARLDEVRALIRKPRRSAELEPDASPIGMTTLASW